MAYRPRGYGLTAEIKRKMESKYDESMELDAVQWMEKVVGEPLHGSTKEALGPLKFQRSLKNGTYLCRLANAIMGPGTCKISTIKIAFKEMENINHFLQACERYGLATTDRFQTCDLYENTNIWQVVLTLYALARKAQAKGFKGPSLGPKEATKNYRNFDEKTLKAGETIIGLQAGTNTKASQKGMAFGNRRHIADFNQDGASLEGQKYIGLQMGTNQVASQKGSSAFGATRGIADMHISESSRESNAVIGLQMGSNKVASQTGMSFGAPRGIADKGLVSEATPQGNTVIGLQMGTNQMASQAGMNYGKSRGIADMKVERPVDHGTINLQMGTNKVASQKGMSFGSKRDIGTHKVVGNMEGNKIIPLQMGTNKGASQSGMSYGKSRGITDIKISENSTSPSRSNRSSLSSQEVDSPRNYTEFNNSFPEKNYGDQNRSFQEQSYGDPNGSFQEQNYGDQNGSYPEENYGDPNGSYPEENFGDSNGSYQENYDQYYDDHEYVIVDDSHVTQK